MPAGRKARNHSPLHLSFTLLFPRSELRNCVSDVRQNHKTRSLKSIRFKLLLTDAELGDNGTIPLDVDLCQVVEKVSPLADHFQEAAAGVMVLLVDAQVIGEVVDSLGENGDLHFGRARVALMARILLDNFSLFC